MAKNAYFESKYPSFEHIKKNREFTMAIETHPFINDFC